MKQVAGKVRRHLAAGASLAVLVALGSSVHAQGTASEAKPDDGDIIVTATRVGEVLSRVPISVAATSQEQMETRGLKEFGDLVRQTPGVAFQQTGGGSNRVSIRGISSGAGAATTGIYIDDVPIQVRAVGYSAGTLFPSLFDLDRVEILRGPQGTLFGAGSEGGTVRFIQPAPDFQDYSGRARAELSKIDGGGTGYELGAAVGGPIVTDKIAFRASGYFRRDAGYIDRLEGQIIVPRAPGQTNEDVIAAAAARGPKDSLSMPGAKLAYRNSNWTETTALRGAIAVKPFESLTITGSLNYQRLKLHDSIGSVWSALTDAGKGRYAAPLFSAGSPSLLLNDPNDPDNPGTGRPYLTPASLPAYNAGKDELYLPYLTLDYDAGPARIISSTSWLVRDHAQWGDSTTGYGFAYLRFVAPRQGDKSASLLTDYQRNFTQEIRIQSNEGDSALRWLVGGFYSNNRQGSLETTPTNFLGLAPSLFGITAADDPFPGTSAFLNTFGYNLLPNSVVYLAKSVAKEKQYAAFAQADYKVTDTLTLTLGARYSINKLRVDAFQDGPENNLNAPYGWECSTPGGCTVGQGEFAPAFARDTLRNKEKVFTPKASVSWQANPDNLFYVTVAKGFRPGGAQVRLPGVCNEQLVAYGFVDGQGNAASPTSYNSDSVWSYEAGSKNRLFNGLVTFDGSIYRIKWNKIQTNLTLPDCGYNLVANLGKATSQGFDALVTVRPARDLVLTGSVGYNSTKFDVTTPVFNKGDYVPGTGAPWTVYLAADYSRPIGDDWEIYGRADYTYNRRTRLTGSVNPTDPGYNPRDVRSPGSEIVTARLGFRVARIDVSIFANNLFNYNRPQGVSYARHSPLYTESYLTPRRIGAQLAYRF